MDIDQVIIELLKLKRESGIMGIDIRLRDGKVAVFTTYGRNDEFPENIPNYGADQLELEVERLKLVRDQIKELLKMLEDIYEKFKELGTEPETLPFSTYRVSWPGGYIENPWWTWFNTTSDNLRINYLW